MAITMRWLLALWWLPVLFCTPARAQTLEVSGSVTFTREGPSEVGMAVTLSWPEWQARTTVGLDSQGISNGELALSYRPGQPTSASSSLQLTRGEPPQLSLEMNGTVGAHTWKGLVRLTPAGLAGGSIEGKLTLPGITFASQGTLGPQGLQTLAASLSWEATLSGWKLRGVTELDSTSLRQQRLELSRSVGCCTITNAVLLSPQDSLRNELTGTATLGPVELRSTSTFDQGGFLRQQLGLSWTVLAGNSLSSTTTLGRQGFESQDLMVQVLGFGIVAQVQSSFDPGGLSSLVATGQADWSGFSGSGLVVARPQGVVSAQLESRLSWNEYFVSGSFNWWLASFESAQLTVGRLLSL